MTAPFSEIDERLIGALAEVGTRSVIAMLEKDPCSATNVICIRMHTISEEMAQCSN